MVLHNYARIHQEKDDFKSMKNNNYSSLAIKKIFRLILLCHCIFFYMLYRYFVFYIYRISYVCIYWYFVYYIENHKEVSSAVRNTFFLYRQVEKKKQLVLKELKYKNIHIFLYLRLNAINFQTIKLRFLLKR